MSNLRALEQDAWDVLQLHHKQLASVELSDSLRLVSYRHRVVQAEVLWRDAYRALEAKPRAVLYGKILDVIHNGHTPGQVRALRETGLSDKVIAQ